jgi:hypothetical protein
MLFLISRTAKLSDEQQIQASPFQTKVLAWHPLVCQVGGSRKDIALDED